MAALPRDNCLPAAARSTRVAGGVHVEVVLTPAGSRLGALAERGGFRGRVTPDADGCSVYLVNPAGGLAGGDAVDLAASAGPGARLVVSTAAAERVYKSAGPPTRVRCRLAAGPGAVLEWLPQQTLFYEGCRFRRRLEVDADPSARVTLLEAVALGRTARGERLDDALIQDDWRIVRGGHLVFADALRLAGPVSTIFRSAAAGGGAHAMATLVHVGPDAEHDLVRARACLDNEVLCGASAVEGVVVARWLAAEPMQLVAALRRFLQAFRGRPAPRGW